MASDMMEWSIRDTKEQIRAGSIIMDGWEVKKQLGKGGFSVVWLAEKSRFGITDQAAIKVIRIPRDSADIDAMRAEGMSDSSIQTELRQNVENAVREVQAMVELRNHPAIVPCEEFDVIQYETDGTWEIDIRMQRLNSLPEWTANKDVKPSDIIRMGISLSDLLAVCEEKNILHRDIKPANIFVDQLNNFKLGDFGLARVISDTSSVHSKGVGAEAFMAPEVFFSGKYDHRADIYSLGLVMYWMLNHQNLPFFTGNVSRNEAIEKRLSGEPLPALPGVDPALDQVIRKACDPNPNKRWKTASEFHDALQNISDQIPPPLPHGRKKSIITIGAVAIAVLLAGYVLARLLNGLPLFPVPVESTTTPHQIAETLEPTPEPTPTPKPTVTPAPASRRQEFVDSIVSFGHYEQDNNTANGREAIEWIVLDYDEANHKALLISKYGLDAIPYNEKKTAITWGKCTLCTWLNGAFLKRAFSAEEQSAILITDVDNGPSQGYSKWYTNSGNNTQDQIFLLSCSEANHYLGLPYDDSNNKKSRVAPTAYAIAQGAYLSNSNQTADGEPAGRWWLRSPGDSQNSAADVSSDGSLSRSDVSREGVVVRPALWVDLAAFQNDLMQKNGP